MVLTAHIRRVPTDDEVWRFLGSFVIIHFDFQSGEASRDAAGVVDRLKGLLAPANRGLAARIWEHLVKKAGEFIPSGGAATRATLAEQLGRDGFSLGPAPSAAWCGGVCAYLTPPEAHRAILDRTFSRDTDTALMIMQGVTKSFIIQAFLSGKDITADNLTLWKDISDWIFASPEWHPDSDILIGNS